VRRAIVVDDERLARRRLRRLLKESGSVRVVEECANGAQAVEALGDTDADVVFLDVQMPGLDGFDVIETVGVAAMPPIVFVTAYEEYAVRAFETNALDYLLKPIEASRLQRALARLERPDAELERRLEALLRERCPEASARFVVKEANRIVIVPVDDVDCIRSEGNYVRLHVGDRSYLLRETMDRLESTLDERFVRIHRSAIARVDRVREIVPLRGGEGDVILAGGQCLPVSRRYRSRLSRVLSL